jgi:hypothetical protein
MCPSKILHLFVAVTESISMQAVGTLLTSHCSHTTDNHFSFDQASKEKHRVSVTMALIVTGMFFRRFYEPYPVSF